MLWATPSIADEPPCTLWLICSELAGMLCWLLASAGVVSVSVKVWRDIAPLMGGGPAKRIAS